MALAGSAVGNSWPDGRQEQRTGQFADHNARRKGQRFRPVFFRDYLG